MPCRRLYSALHAGGRSGLQRVKLFYSNVLVPNIMPDCIFILLLRTSLRLRVTNAAVVRKPYLLSLYLPVWVVRCRPGGVGFTGFAGTCHYLDSDQKAMQSCSQNLGGEGSGNKIEGHVVECDLES